MKKKVRALLSIVFAVFTVVFFVGLRGAQAFDQITAQEAYDMVSSGEAAIIDVRTLEEYTFAGSPSLEAGGEPIACLIPWKLFDGIDENGNIIYKNNPDFDAVVIQTFGDNKYRALITMCKVGIRSTYAAERLEQLGFTNVYELDNRLKELSSYPGGCGGFQGSSYNGEANGYMGFPGRLPSGLEPAAIKVVTVTDDIEHENDSVCWMDTGLPVTQKIDPEKIPKLKKVEPQSTGTFSWPQTISTYPSLSYQTIPYGQPYYSQSYVSQPYFSQPAYFEYPLSVTERISQSYITTLPQQSWNYTQSSQTSYMNSFQGSSMADIAAQNLYFTDLWQTGSPSAFSVSAPISTYTPVKSS